MALHDTRSAQVRWFGLTTFAEAIGDQMARTLAPVIAVSLLGAGTATVGLLHSLGLAMFLLLSIPLGIAGDRLSRPAGMMTISTALRIAFIACGVLAWTFGALEGRTGITILLAIMLMVGIADVVYTTGRSILVPRMVPAEQIRPMMGTVQTAAQIGTALAPIALALLLALAAPPLAWIGALLAYLASLFFQAGLRGNSRPARAVAAPARPTSRPPLREGITHLLTQPTLRRITASSALYNAAVMAANTLLPVIVLTDLGMSPAVFAAVGGIGAVCGVLGAASASRITARFGLRVVRIMAALSTGAGVGVILVIVAAEQLVPGPPVTWIGIFYALSGFCTSVAAVTGADLVARLSPPEVIGAVAGAQRTMTMGVMPVSALLIGALGASLGSTVATAIWLLLALGAALPCFRLPDHEIGPGPRPAALAPE